MKEKKKLTHLPSHPRVLREKRRNLELWLVLWIVRDLVNIGPCTRGGPEPRSPHRRSNTFPLFVREYSLVFLFGADLEKIKELGEGEKN